VEAFDLIKVTGQHLLFLGLSTHGWTPEQFHQAALFARAHDIDCLLVKVADGGNLWYGGLDGWNSRRDIILKNGVGAIPYMYSYGNKFGALDTEIDIMLTYMADGKIFCADMEEEWNGQVNWANYLASRLRGVPGTFLVSTWADPSLQNWQGVIRALAPVTSVFMPQQYNNYLATFWAEFAANGAVWLQPTVQLTQEFGANDPVRIARAAYDQGHTALSVWYFEPAGANPGLLDAVYAAFPRRMMTGGSTQMGGIPQGWKDDGAALSAPNGHRVISGFRNYILSHEWDGGNVPLGEEYRADPVQLHRPDLGAGVRQLFRDGVLWYVEGLGPVYEAYLGLELDAAYQLLAEQSEKITALQDTIANNPAQKRIDAFKEALKAL
jgi:hypothetical protein